MKNLGFDAHALLEQAEATVDRWFEKATDNLMGAAELLSDLEDVAKEAFKAAKQNLPGGPAETVTFGESGETDDPKAPSPSNDPVVRTNDPDTVNTVLKAIQRVADKRWVNHGWTHFDPFRDETNMETLWRVWSRYLNGEWPPK